MTFILPSFGASAISAVPASGGASPWSGNTYSVDFDGTDDYVDTNSTFQSTYQSSHTISFWFKLDNTSSLQSLFGAWSGPTSQNAIYFDGSASIVHRYRVASSPKATTSAAFTADTNWHHYAVTLTQNGSNLDVKTYIDGVYKSTNTEAITMSGFSQSNNSYIGFRNGSTGYLDGKMDEVVIIGSALSDGGVSTGQTAGGDIATLYNSGTPSDISSLSPVAWYRMGDNNSGTGTTITDQGSGGTNGTLTNGPTFSTDVPVAPSLTNTYSLSLDGTNDDCTVSNYAQTGSFSLSMWINPQAAISGSIYLFYKEASGVNGMNLDITSNTLRWTLYDDTQHPSPTTALVRYAPCTVAQNQWHHIVVTYDGSTSYTGMNHYIDGVKATSHSSEQNYGTNPTFQSAATSTIYVGTRGLYNNRFPLLVDEVAIFDKELSQSDVDSLRDGTSGQGNAIPADISSMADLDIWLRMEEGSGTSVVNTANSGTNDATLVNGPTFSTTVPS